MIRSYRSLLPNYLRDGENILKHADVLETQDKKIYEKLCEVDNAYNLNRPILIERVQSEPMIASVTVHVHSPFPIKKITIKKGYQTPYNTVTVDYDEDDCVTEYEYTYTEGNNERVNVLPYCDVTVETYEGITYMKGYPENDEPMGTQYDHDEYLDIIGNFLGLPRRRYKEVVTGGQDPSEYTGLYPPYFTKVNVPGHDHHIGDLLTEDDYYYMSRLKHFSENVRQGNILKLMGEVLYELKDAKTFNLTDRTTETIETEGLIGNNVLAIEQDNTYRNIDYTNQTEILSQYIPVTRKLIVVHASESDLGGPVAVTNFYTNYLAIHIDCIYSDDDWDTEHPLVNAPIHATITINGTDIETVGYTDENGTAMLVWGGIPPIDTLLSIPFVAKYDEAYEIASSTISTTMSLVRQVSNYAKMSLDAWNYDKYYYSTAQTITPPSVVNNELFVGIGCVCYTPILNPSLIDMDAYTISCDFHYTGSTQFLSLARIVKSNLDSSRVKMNDRLQIYPRKYEAHDVDIETTHNVTWKFIDKKGYIYYDEIYTGLSYDYSDVPSLLQLVAYNIRQQNNGLYIVEVSVEDSVDISTAPVGRLDVLDTYNFEKWATIQRSSTNTPPSVDNTGYNIGKNYYNVFQEYIVPKNAKNKTVEIEFNNNNTPSFWIGLVRYETTNVSWNSTYFASTQATFSTGTHILKFVADNNGEWTTYLDGTRTSTNAFTLPNQSKVGAANFNNTTVKILGVRVYDNNN